MSIRDRLYEKKFEWHIKVHSKASKKRIARVVNGHVYQGTASMHLLDSSRRIRCLRRLKLNRSVTTP